MVKISLIETLGIDTLKKWSTEKQDEYEHIIWNQNPSVSFVLVLSWQDALNAAEYILANDVKSLMEMVVRGRKGKIVSTGFKERVQELLLDPVWWKDYGSKNA